MPTQDNKIGQGIHNAEQSQLTVIVI
jgi:hypothetical protein